MLLRPSVFVVLLFLLNPDYVTAYEEKTLILSGYWKRIFEEENNSPVTIEYTRTYSTGMKTYRTDEKTVTNSHTVGFEVNGQVGTVLSVGLSYEFQHQTESKTITGSEIHKSKEQTVTFTVPGWTRLVRWQFVVNFEGDSAYEYDYTVTATNSTERPKTMNVTATVRLRKQIHLGSTPIRIKHKGKDQYMIIVTRKKWPAATLSSSNRFHYVLQDKGSRGFRIRAFHSTIYWKDYLFASIDKGVYFDLSKESGDAGTRKQHWYLNRAPPLYDGDVVTFRNNFYDNSYLCYWCGGNSRIVDLFHKKKSEEEWILEVV